MLRRFPFLCLSFARPSLADTEVYDVSSCDVDVTFLQTDMNVLHEIPRLPEYRHQESHEPNAAPLAPVVKDHHHSELGELRSDGHKSFTNGAKRQTKQPLDTQPFVLFQTDSVVHHSNEKAIPHLESLSKDVTRQFESDWVLQAALIGTVLCSLWLARFFSKRWVTPSDGGAKGILEAELAKASTTTLASDEDAQPAEWNARLFSTPVREAFGLSVDPLQTAEGEETSE